MHEEQAKNKCIKKSLIGTKNNLSNIFYKN